MTLTYRNTKTGATATTSVRIVGGNWEPVKTEKAKAEEVKTEEVKTAPEPEQEAPKKAKKARK